MQLQHPTLTGTLAEQHRDELYSQAEQARLARSGRLANQPRWPRVIRWRRLTARTANL
jgi:hypothetical protein